MMSPRDLVFGRFVVEEMLSDGGQADVARGLDLQTGQRVAIRQLRARGSAISNQREIRRFERAGALQIPSPHVANPIQCGEERGERYTIYPYIDGGDLSIQLLRAGGVLAPTQVESVLRHIASALAACRVRGVVHRDIKPANILLDSRGEAHLIDFGICRCVHEATLSDGDRFIGSVQWAAPEQITSSKSVDHRSDLYALGAVAYHCLTGNPPIQGQTAQEIMYSVCTWNPPAPRTFNSGIPAHLDRLCMHLLEKSPSRRPQIAENVLGDLDGRSSSDGGAFCHSCGCGVSVEARFCARCGASRVSAVLPVRCLACGAAVSTASACTDCGRPFGSIDHRLTFVGGTLSGAVFRVPQGEYDVGRASLEPRDTHISRRHFQVRCNNGDVSLTDLGSANTIRIAGTPATQKTCLVPQMEIRIAGNLGIYTCN